MAAQFLTSRLTTPAVVIILLASLGLSPSLFNGSRAMNAQPTPAPMQSQSVRDPQIKPQSALALLDDFFDLDAGEKRTREPWSGGLQPSHDQWGTNDARAGYSLSFLVATLPAPASPPLRYEFDAFLDAIQLALGRVGYTLDSFALPWIGDNSSPDAAGDEDKRAAAHARPSSVPGVLLFHRARDKRLVTLFVVGETPTRGVDKAELHDAMNQIAWLSGWSAPDDPASPAYLAAATADFSAANEVGIIGPTFSGSAFSIRAVLDEWFAAPAGTNRRIRIVSGTATAVEGALDDPRIDFHAVRIPDAAIMAAVIADLRVGLGNLKPAGDQEANAPEAHTGAGGRIAILSDNTAYGSAATAPGARRMAFPLHISDLRTAFSRIEPAPSPMSSPFARSELPVGNETDLNDRDTVPRFSARTAAYNELVLETMLESINREHIRYVGVVATDVEDLVFLVRRIRDYCPNSIVFTISSSLRFLHSDVNHELDGVLVFSTYPLFASNQAWTYPFRGEHLEFPSEDAEGVFNATLALVGDRGAMVEYGAPFAPPAAVKEPALWVGVVGNNGIWPLGFQSLPQAALSRVFPADFAAGVDPPAMHLDLGGLYTTVMEVTFFILSLVCLIPCYLLLCTEFVPAPPRAQRSWGEMVMGDAVLGEFRRERWMRISAFVGGWLMVYAVALMFLLLPLRVAYGIAVAGRPLADLIGAGRSMSLPVILACVTGVIVMIVLAVAQGITLARIPGRVAGSKNDSAAVAAAPTGAIFSLIGTGVGFVLVGIFLYRVWIQPAPFAMLTFIRAANLRSSVSPLMPLLFLGAANLCLIGCDIWQLSLLEDCRMELPFLGFDDGGESFRGTGAHERVITRLLQSPPWELPRVGFILCFSLIVLAAFAMTNGWPPIHSIDGAAFDWLFFLSAIFIYTYFSIVLLRFVLVWNALHKLLRRLYWHPTRACYETLRVKSLPGRPDDQRIRVIEPTGSLTAMEFCLERVREMLRIGDELKPEAAKPETPAANLLALRGDLEADVRTVERHLSEVLAAQENDGWQAALSKRITAQRAMASISRRITTILEPLWRMTAGPLPALEAADNELLENGELFIASRVVDFIRHTFVQLRVLAAFAMAGVLTMMLAISSYPFPNHNTLLWLSWVVLLTAVLVCLSVFVSINRDRVISMLSGTQPGRFNWDSTIVMRMLLYGALPILTLLGAQLPGGLGGIVGWIGGLFGGGH